MFERLVYTNSAGNSVAFSTTSPLFCNIRKDVKGMNNVKTSLYSEPIVDMDGEVETGYHVESRDITILGKIKTRNFSEQDSLATELLEVFSPHLTGVLTYEGSTIKEIDVRPESAPDITEPTRWPQFFISLVALNPNWRATSEKEVSILTAGTDIYYEGSKACGVEIEITAGADNIDVESLTVTNGTNVETITFRTAGDVELDTNDVILVDTTPGNISVKLNAADAFARVDFNNTVWVKLYPGTNTITWSAYGDEANITVDVRYTPLYLGAW